MPKRRGKPISFDAMIKFFMQNYNIPTKKDFDKLMARLDRMEELMRTAVVSGRHGRTSRANVARKSSARESAVKTASDTVLETIKSSRDGAGFAEIQQRTGYDDKKLRNIIFRLNKLGKISRVRRGSYTAL